MGRGLVHPLDLDHPGNPPSHPELLDLLAAEFAAHGHDVKWLLREIALSKTYQRSSAAPADAPPDRYLAAALKPLTAEQLAYAVAQATGPVDAPKRGLARLAAEAARDARSAPLLVSFRRTFGGASGEPADGSEATLDQSLFLKHGATVRGLIAPKAGNLTDRIGKLTDGGAAADELFLSVLGRPPTAEERNDVAELLAGPDRSAAAEAVWALVASAEFRFNH
jgi:hypothetical protein